jgi:general secretion pathway protein G
MRKQNVLHLNTKAFTLIEILAVVMIIGLIMGVLIKNISGSTTSAKEKMTSAMIVGTLGGSLQEFELDNGSFPTTEQGLRALVDKPSGATERWHTYLNSVPKDPWNEDYIYVCPGTHNPSKFDLSSKGVDKQEGTADDITNWKK